MAMREPTATVFDHAGDVTHVGLARRTRRRRALVRHLAVWAAVAALALLAQTLTPYTH